MVQVVEAEEGGIAKYITEGEKGQGTRALTMDMMEEVRMDRLELTEKMVQVSKKI